jgi:Concanavalin A-like lectin/glucanases superfamily/Secretion system C-terminal sorting domain
MKQRHPLIWLSLCYVAFLQLLTAQPCVGPPVGMVGWWPGDGNGQDIRSNNNAVLVNGTSFGLAKVAQGFLLDGVNDYLQIPNAGNLAVTSVTVEAWIKPTVIDQFQRVVSNSSAYDLFLDNSAQLRFIINPQSSGPGTGIDVGFVGPVNAGEWIHVAGTYDESTGIGRIYLNGVQRASLDLQDSNPLISHGNTVFIGSAAGVVSYFQGLIDEISVYDRSLAAQEIQSIVKADTAGKCKSPVYVEAERNPLSFSLRQNFPNPFNSITTIPFAIPSSGIVELEVHNLLGEKVAVLVNEEVTPGTYIANWDASGMPSGVYLYRLTTSRHSEAKKLILLR